MEMAHRAVKSQGVVLVVIDLSREVSSSAVNWALENAVRHGDLLRLVGIITHVQNQSKSRNRRWDVIYVFRYCRGRDNYLSIRSTSGCRMLNIENFRL